MDRPTGLPPPLSLPAEPGEKRAAAVTALVSLAILVVLVFFARIPLPRIEPFIPAYQAALVLTDLTTFALLLGQWQLARSRRLAVLASGYLFTAAITVAHTLTFPGLFAPRGLLGAGEHSTAWIYMFWHAVFPLAVTAYAWLPERRIGGRGVMALSAGAILLAAGLTALATAGQDWLPGIMQGNRYAPLYRPTVALVWACSLVGFWALWRRPRHSVLDVWLMVVLCAWTCDIALAAVFNAGRFDLGFYAGRIFGLLAASFVLWVMLYESLVLYRRMADAVAAEAQAQEASRAKDTFLAMLGHELRNPLNAMAASAQLLRSTRDAGKAQMAGEVIARQVTHLGKLADDLLDVGRALFGKIALRPEAVDFRALVAEQLALAGHTGIFARHRLEQRLQPVWVFGDPTRLGQMVGNLLVNAAKFTPPGGRVDVTLALEQGEAVLSVRDSGIGMAPELLARVFDPFVQGESGADRQQGGLGIGLTLVRRLVELHHGRIEADSRGPGRGSEFRLRLPAVDAPQAAVPRAEASGTPARPLRVVIVEDNDDARATLREVLLLRGHTVEEATDGEAGLALILQRQPDVAIVDIGLPKLDGWSLARTVRARAGRACRLIALSGYGLRDPDDRPDAFDAYLMKPVDMPRLHALIEDGGEPLPRQARGAPDASLGFDVR